MLRFAPSGRSFAIGACLVLVAVGLYAFFYYVGGSLGGALPGVFWERGGWQWCVFLVVGVQLVTIALAMMFWKSARPGGRAYVPEVVP